QPHGHRGRDHRPAGARGRGRERRDDLEDPAGLHRAVAGDARPVTPRRFDESEIRDRPSRRGSRPRTKLRPEHADAERAMVTGVDRGRYSLLMLDENGELGEGAAERRVTAMKARELGRGRIVVGDRVDVVGDTSGEEGTLARIVRIAERTTV